MNIVLASLAVACAPALIMQSESLATDEGEACPGARDIGIIVGELSAGSNNAITDVAGIRVGYATVFEGEDIRTGVTAIIPATGNLYTDPVPAWIYVGNGYGKLIGGRLSCS